MRVNKIRCLIDNNSLGNIEATTKVKVGYDYVLNKDKNSNDYTQ